MKPNLLNKYSNRNHTFQIKKSAKKTTPVKSKNASIAQDKSKNNNPNKLPSNIVNKQNALRQATLK